jgi:hypothetical protein
MSKTIMWSQTDLRGFTAECLFNEDERRFEVLVSANGPWICRSDDFPAGAEPVPDMDDADLSTSVALAERLIHEVARDLGDR